MADETIIIKYIADVKEAIDDAQRMRDVINAIKADFKTMSSESGKNLKDLEQSLIKTFKSLSKTDTEKLGQFLKIDPETLKNTQEFTRARQEALTLIRRATSELGQEERTQATMSAKAIKEAKTQEVAAQREYEKVTKQGYGVMSQAAQAYGQQVQQVKQQIVTQSQASGQTYQQVATQMQQAGTSANVLNTALKQLNQTGNATKSSFGGLGDVFKYVFGTVLGLNIVNILRSMIGLLREAAEAGYELAKSFFQLEVGTRAIRRAGVDITSKEILDNLERLREKFGVFSRKELVEGAAAFINLVRDMGFTKDQIFELQDAIATLAVVNGRAMGEVQRTVALALASGYTEGLQRLGVSINRVNIAARAATMGFSKGYMALTEYERAAATLSLVLEKTAKYQSDLTSYLETAPGRLDAATASTEDQEAAIGDKLIPALQLWQEVLRNLYIILGGILSVADPFIDFLASLFSNAKLVRDEVNRLNEAGGTQISVIREWIMWFDAMRKSIERIRDETFGGTWWGDLWGVKKPENVFPDDVEVGTPELSSDGMEDSAGEIKDIVDELYDDIQKETRNFNNRMAELARDLGYDLARIERELARDLAEIDRDKFRDLVDMQGEYLRDLDKIRQDGIRDEAKAREDYARNIEEENRRYANNRADLEAKYRENEIQAEIDFQEKLKRLREGFIFDLEDALHERDARQILNLIRRYNLEKDQTKRQFNIETEERRRQHQLQLEELARQREERMQALAEELDARVAQIRQETQWELEARRQQYILEIEDRNRRAEEEKEERKRKAAEEKAERLIRQEELKEELKIDSENRLKEIVAALANEEGVTAAMLENIGNEYKRIYGKNGVIEAQIKYYIGLLNALSAAISGVSSARPTMLGVAGGQFGGNTSVKTSSTAKGEGGIMYADKPTTVTFGDSGIEVAEFTPLSKVGKNVGEVDYSNMVGKERSSAGGTISLRVLLSPDLIAEIQENTLDAAADVMFEVQRRA